MRKYSYEDIVKALREVGIERGDTVYLSSNLGVVGAPPPEVKNLDDLCSLFLKAILDVIGSSGTLLVPCFSYSFGGSSASSPAVFNPRKTCPEIGAFPVFVSKLKGIRRNRDPMLSVCEVGNPSPILEPDKQCSYCEGSFLSKLAKSDAKLLNIGIGPNWLPFIHYIDWLVKAPHRFDKVFGGIVEDPFPINSTWLYSVRVLSDISYPCADRVGYEALEKGIWRKAKLGSVHIYSCLCRDYFRFALSRAKEDPWVLAKGPPADVLSVEKERTGKEVVDLSYRGEREEEVLRNLLTLPRDPVSDSYRFALSYVTEFLGLENYSIIKIPSGYHAFGHVVPERWVLRYFSLKDKEGRVIFESSSEESLCRIFRHSTAVKGEFTKEELMDHLHLSGGHLKCISCTANRDWGFSLRWEELSLIRGDSFTVEIDADFSFGELTLLEKLFNISRGKPYVVFIAYLGGPYRADAHLSGIFVMRRLLRVLESGGMDDRFNYGLVIVPDEVGFSAWVSERFRTLPVGMVVNLKFLGNNFPFTLFVNSRKFIRENTYLQSDSFFYGMGNDPVLDRIVYPELNILTVMRSPQPFSHRFGKFTEWSERDLNVDFNCIEESSEFILRLLSKVDL